MAGVVIATSSGTAKAQCHFQFLIRMQSTLQLSCQVAVQLVSGTTPSLIAELDGELVAATKMAVPLFQHCARW